jgi:pimeloyl-[acyl-carrier protein] methyl ester esterase
MYNGNRVKYYDKSSDKPLVLIINGWSMTELIMEPLKNSFINLGSECEIIDLHDLPLVTDKKILLDYKTFFSSIREKSFNKMLHVIGWSMGGNIASKLAENLKDKVKSLTLISSNPCFVSKTDWQQAMNREEFDEFQNKMQQNSSVALLQFAKLCALGNKMQKTHTGMLKQSVLTGKKLTAKLNVLLQLLAELDTRDSLSKFTKPVLQLFGSKDALIPIAVMDKLSKLYPHHIIKSINSGHSFFLDNHDYICRKIYNFHQLSDLN